MFVTVLVLAAAGLAAGFVFKKDETVALLKNVVAWVVAAGTAAVTYFTDLDFTKFFG